jgi:hypothetical protein
MPKRKIENKKMQLRRCGFCQKTGHNKSTCEQKFSEPADIDQEAVPAAYSKQTVRPPLNFFVHHVQYQNHESAHIVNLRNSKRQLHADIQAVAPKENKDYYFFHNSQPKTIPPITPVQNQPLAIPLPDEAETKIIPKMYSPSFAPKTALTKKPAVQIESASPTIKNRRPLKARLATTFSRIKNAHIRTAQQVTHKIKTKAAPKHFARAAALLLFLLFVPSTARTYYSDLKSTTNQIADNSTAGFSALHDSTSALMTGDLGTAQISLTDALHNFDQAVHILDNKYSFLQKVIAAVPIVNKEIQSRQKLITAGQEVSLGNTYLLKGLSEIQDNNSTLTQNLALIGNHLNSSLPHYQTAITQLNTVDSDVLPFEYQDTFKEFRVLFNVYVKDLENIAKLNSSVQEIFGGKGLRRYLLIFQNPAELRPTGGFMGSFAMIDIKDGEIINIDIPAGGSYDLQGQLSEYVAPPTPLLLSNKRWEFQDANWFPDFPASANKILWFYRHSRNLTADGVIAINASVLNRLLSLIGPVAEENRGLVLDKTNALETIQNIVEYGPEKKANKPKQILSDLAPIFIDNFKKMKPQAALPLLANLEESLQQKEIQVYFADENTEKTIKEFGWSGEITKTNEDQDYLFVVNTNIQGQKSDARIKQDISHQAVIQPDGTILDSVVISREHTGTAGEELYGQTNIDYMRIYVPAGSELVRASGFVWPDEKMFKVASPWSKKDPTLTDLEKEITIDSASGTRITNEFGKTAFGNWIITEPGQTSQVQFIYKLPFKAWEDSTNSNLSNWAKIFQTSDPTSKFQLIVQKQSGIDSTFESQVIYPEGWSPIWQDGTAAKAASNGLSIDSTKLDTDKIWSLVMKKNDN